MKLIIIFLIMSEKLITRSIAKHNEALKSLDKNIILSASEMIIKAINNGNKVFWCGNGGSSSQANHLSAELLGGMYKDKIKPFESICLNIDTAFITAWSNDDSFDNIFARQLEALGAPGDIVIVLSTSGNSTNLLNAADFAIKKKLNVISFTGNDGGKLKNKSDLNINISSSNTQSIQELHILVGHILCALVEDYAR